MNDIQSAKPVLLNEEACNQGLQAYQQQLKQRIPKTTPAPLSKTAVLKNLRDSASYAAGIFVTNFYHSNGIININSSIAARAINDLQSGRKSLLSDKQANDAVIAYLNKLQREKAKPRIEAGEKFLAENKNRPGVITTASGLQYEIISQGTGPIPTRNDSVTCNYKGYYTDGTEFDNSYRTGKPVKFSITGVITGWTEALLLMPVGSKWKLYIPYQLGYGPGDYQGIPGGSALLFDIELVSIVPK
jgi:FKBP-type peptidyl-prolyl cis-trans isomerase FklB